MARRLLLEGGLAFHPPSATALSSIELALLLGFGAILLELCFGRTTSLMWSLQRFSIWVCYELGEVNSMLLDVDTLTSAVQVDKGNL